MYWIYIHRWDVDVPDSEYLEKRKRTLQSFYDNYQNKQDKGCKHLPLLKLDPDNIIPDELHLLLRITDILIHNLISAAKTFDKKNNRRLTLLEGNMIKALIAGIESCGVSFNIWEKDGSFECTSLMGDDKKKVLKLLPSKITTCQPLAFASEVKKLWEVRSYIDFYTYIAIVFIYR